jgi:hypothetical protein
MTAATLKSPAALARPAPSHSAIRARRFLLAIVKALQASRREHAARHLEDLASLHRSSSEYASQLRAAARSLRESD